MGSASGSPVSPMTERTFDVFRAIGCSGLFLGEFTARNAAHAGELAANECNLVHGTKIVVSGVYMHGEPMVALFTISRDVSLVKGHV